MVKDIICIKYADSTIPENWIFDGGSKNEKVPIIFSVFLILTESKKIMVDAGCETMSGFEMYNFTTPMAVLSENGIATEDITDIIITHSHHDHIECVKYFKNAVVHIQRDELVLGEKYIPHNLSVNAFDTGFLIEKDVKIVKIGGHSVGSCIVECKKDSRNFVLCGDECYSYYNLKNKAPTAISFSRENSMEFIKKYSKKQYECLLCHEYIHAAIK